MSLRTGERLLLILIFILSVCHGNAQDQFSDTLTFSALHKSRLSFILDDTYLIGGVNRSGIYYSNHFRYLSFNSGYSLGIEQYLPLSGKMFLSSGVNFSQRNFSYFRDNTSAEVRSLYLDVPITAAFELPVLRSVDFRIFFGAAGGFRLSSDVRGNYLDLLSAGMDLFVYNRDDFQKMDFGWHFGFSAEYRNILFRARSYSGFVKFDRKDQGMMSSFNLEIGYFLFRH